MRVGETDRAPQYIPIEATDNQGKPLIFAIPPADKSSGSAQAASSGKTTTIKISESTDDQSQKGNSPAPTTPNPAKP